MVTVTLIPGGIGEARELGRAAAGNMSNLQDLSNYTVRVQEGHNPTVPMEPWTRSFNIYEHNRRQSVWALVEKIAHGALNGNIAPDKRKRKKSPKRKPPNRKKETR